jgi:sodium-coupled neutral amino acid transporter 2
LHSNGNLDGPLLTKRESAPGSQPGDGDDTPWLDRERASLSANGLLYDIQDDNGEASWRGTIFNAINGILGGGILALPFSLRLDGALLGTIMIMLVATLGERSLHMLLYCADHTGARLYAQIGTRLVGWKMGKLVDLTVLLQNFGLCTGYIVILGDLLPSIFSDWGVGQIAHGIPNRTLLLILISGLIFFPLSSLPKLDFLKHTSMLAFLFVCVLVVTSVVLGADALNNPDDYPDSAIAHEPVNLGPASGGDGFVNFLQSVPIVFFAFVVHNTALLLYGELRRRSKQDRASRWSQKRRKMLDGMRIALLMCVCLYSSQAVFGILLFRDTTLSDVLSNFSHSQFPWFMWIKLAYAMVIVFSFPLIAIALRQSVHNFAFPTKEPNAKYRVAQALGIAFFTALVGILVPNPATVFGLTGSLTATNVMYCYPAGFFLILRLKHKKPQEFPGDIALAVLILVVGAMVCIGSTAGILYKLV